MNTIKKIALFFILFFEQDVLLAQTSNVTFTATLANPTGVTEKVITNDTLVAPQTTSEPTPTPEQQGFTKVLMEGKTLYYKKIDGVVIEYKPE